MMTRVIRHLDCGGMFPASFEVIREGESEPDFGFLTGSRCDKCRAEPKTGELEWADVDLSERRADPLGLRAAMAEESKRLLAAHQERGAIAMRSRSAFTLIELLVVVAIIAILAAILFPVFARARLKAKSAACQSNLKQLALAIRMYCDDSDGYGPFNTCGSFVYNKLANGGYGPAYGIGGYSSLYACPAGGNYGMNRYRGAQCADGGSQQVYPWNIDAGVKHPEAVMLIADSQSALTGNASYFWNAQADGLMTPRHLGVNQIAFCDGHVKGVTPQWLKDDYDNADPLTGRGNWYWWWY